MHWPNFSKSGNKGFTLIETLVYLALLGLVFTGLMAAGFAIVESLDILKTRAVLQEEGNFMLAKLNWAVTGSQTATTTADSLVLGSPNHNFQYDSANNDLKMDGGILNASVAKVKDVSFAVSGAAPQIKVETAFTVYSLTPTGRYCDQPFKVTNYLRK